MNKLGKTYQERQDGKNTSFYPTIGLPESLEDKRPVFRFIHWQLAFQKPSRPALLYVPDTKTPESVKAKPTIPDS